MQYLYGKVDTKMNEVFEMVAEVLEELRSEAGEREYSVCTKERRGEIVNKERCICYARYTRG